MPDDASANSARAQAFRRLAKEDGISAEEVSNWSLGTLHTADWCMQSVKPREEMFRLVISYAVVAQGVHSSSRLQSPDLLAKPLCAGDGAAFLALLFKLLPEDEKVYAKLVSPVPSRRCS